MDGWMDWIDGLIDLMDGWIDNGWMDGWMDGWMQMDGWMDQGGIPPYDFCESLYRYICNNFIIFAWGERGRKKYFAHNMRQDVAMILYKNNTIAIKPVSGQWCVHVY